MWYILSVQFNQPENEHTKQKLAWKQTESERKFQDYLQNNSSYNIAKKGAFAIKKLFNEPLNDWATQNSKIKIRYVAYVHDAVTLTTGR